MCSIGIKTILHLSRKLVQYLVKHPVLVYLIVFTIQNLQNTLIHGGVSTNQIVSYVFKLIGTAF